jgi:hypothetical protein
MEDPKKDGWMELGVLLTRDREKRIVMTITCTESYFG